MYQLEKLQENDFNEVWGIMKDSFPIDEIRTKEGQKQLLANDNYNLYGYRKGDKLASFFAVWDFKDFAFVEHFAVKKEARNGGIGARLLQQLLKQLDKMVILEVELPETELSCRRIKFYERNGFTLNHYPYIQPPLSKKGQPIPLQIMSSPKALEHHAFQEIKNTLYQRVYKAGLSWQENPRLSSSK